MAKVTSVITENNSTKEYLNNISHSFVCKWKWITLKETA